MRFKREALILSVTLLLALAVAFVVISLVRSVQAEAQRDEVILQQNAELLQGNAELLARIAELERIGNSDVAEHREFNQADHNCIIAVLLTLPQERQRQAMPEACLAAPAVTRR